MHTYAQRGVSQWGQSYTGSAREWGVDLQHVCEYYSSQGSFPRNLWHKLPLSHYLMTKHSHKPPPMALLNITLRALAQKKSPHTSTENLSFPQLTLCTSLPSTEINKIRWLRVLFMNEVKTRGVIIPCFQVANTRLSMALFVSLKCNKSISIYESPSL